LNSLLLFNLCDEECNGREDQINYTLYLVSG
jgi:hypothetical protein